MTDRELQRLSRAELLGIMLDQSKRIAELEEQVAELEARVQSRKIILEQAGSIAEAALRLNGVFDAAQKAADQYLDNVQRLAAADGRDRT